MNRNQKIALIVLIAILILSQVKLCTNCLKQTTSQIDPLYGINTSKPISVGLASYGLINNSGTYALSTNEIIGNITISNISILNTTNNKLSSKHGASLQLNIMMKLISTDNKTHVYWLQNMLQFEAYNAANNSYLAIPVDNVWNYTKFDSNISNATLRGKGKVSYDRPTFNNSFYLYRPSGWFPMVSNQIIHLEPYIRLEKQSNKTTVLFGYNNADSPFGNSSYDKVVFNISTKTAYLLIDPYNITPPAKKNGGGLLYDAEFVFAGQCCLVSSTFNSMNAQMWLFYVKNGSIHPFNNLRTFGRDTGENASNLSVEMGINNATIEIGKLNYTRILSLNSS